MVVQSNQQSVRLFVTWNCGLSPLHSPRTVTNLLGDHDLRCDAEEAGDGEALEWKK